MLVLSRKESQRIRLGDSIVVTIVKIAGDKVRVGIEAPADVLVLRDELQRYDSEQGETSPKVARKPAVAKSVVSAPVVSEPVIVPASSDQEVSLQRSA